MTDPLGMSKKVHTARLHVLTVREHGNMVRTPLVAVLNIHFLVLKRKVC
jgi:hypothetical protein